MQTVGVWFDECRYGMFVHSNIATVPAFAPLHEYADWYWAFLEPKPDVVLHPTCPLPEVVAWHLEHFGDRPFDDFISELTYERFDADWYARLLDDAGMRYAVLVTKHHDGFCWWDTALTTRKHKRDVVGELADAVRRQGHVFGCYYSLLDWATLPIPIRKRTSTRSCVRRSKNSSSGTTQRCFGAMGTGATPARTGALTRSSKTRVLPAPMSYSTIDSSRHTLIS